MPECVHLSYCHIVPFCPHAFIPLTSNTFHSFLSTPTPLLLASPTLFPFQALLSLKKKETHHTTTFLQFILPSPTTLLGAAGLSLFCPHEIRSPHRQIEENFATIATVFCLRDMEVPLGKGLPAAFPSFLGRGEPRHVCACINMSKQKYMQTKRFWQLDLRQQTLQLSK